MLDINEMTFGCEFEITLPAGRVPVGGYHSGRQVEGFPQGWNAQGDGSISATIPGHVGAEIVSPILKGANGLLQIKEVLEKLNAMGARVNRSCGFHVHVGFPRQVIGKMGNLCYLVANLEKAIYASTGTKNRERNGFCRSIKGTDFVRSMRFDQVAAQNDASVAVARRVDSHRSSEFYTSLNLHNLLCGRRPTVEFRAFAGTLNFSKVVGHVRMCLALVEKACDSSRRVAWDAAVTRDVATVVTGKSELHRFFYRMGWHSGGTTNGKVYGNLQADGVGNIEESKRILGKMAEKYDTCV